MPKTKKTPTAPQPDPDIHVGEPIEAEATKEELIGFFADSYAASKGLKVNTYLQQCGCCEFHVVLPDGDNDAVFVSVCEGPLQT